MRRVFLKFQALDTDVISKVQVARWIGVGVQLESRLVFEVKGFLGERREQREITDMLKINFFRFVGARAQVSVDHAMIHDGGIGDDNLGMKGRGRVKQAIILREGVQASEEGHAAFIAGDLVDHKKEVWDACRQFAHAVRQYAPAITDTSAGKDLVQVRESIICALPFLERLDRQRGHDGLRKRVLHVGRQRLTNTIEDPDRALTVVPDLIFQEGGDAA